MGWVTTKRDNLEERTNKRDGAPKSSLSYHPPPCNSPHGGPVSEPDTTPTSRNSIHRASTMESAKLHYDWLDSFH